MSQDQSPEVHDDERALLEHSYDGIQEYDNPLPRWWVALFWLTIVFAPMYILYYHFGPGPLEIERYDAAMIAFYDRQAAQLLAMGEIDENLLVGLMADSSMVGGGKAIFQAKCAACHGMFAEGGIGPNLTDDFWIHGPQLEDIYRVVRDGVPEKGMLAWERQLRPAELLAVSAYVGTVVGTAPANPKPPEGAEAVRLPPPEQGTDERTAAAEPAPADAV